MKSTSPQTRKLIYTFIAAGLGAVVLDHMLKPGLKKRLGI